MMTVTVKQGNLQVVQTGTVLISNNESTTITLDESYEIVLSYKDDTSDTAQNISAKPLANGVSLELKNFNNPLGSATISPIAIASQGTQTIFLSFSVAAVGKSKILTYGIYLGKQGEG